MHVFPSESLEDCHRAGQHEREGPFCSIFAESFVSKTNLFQIDCALRKLNGIYNGYRTNGGLGELQVVLLQPGTFRQLKEFMVGNTMTSALQYKVPRVARRPEVIQFLAGKVLE